MDLLEVLGVWEDIGVFNVILPFLLIFSVVYAVLDKIKILGDRKAPNAIVSLVIALLVVRNQYVVGLMTRFLPNIAMFLIIILMFLLLLGTLAGREHTAWKNPLLSIAFFVSLIFVIWALASERIGDWFNLPEWISNLDDTTKATVLFIGVFVVIIYFMTRDSKEGEEGTWDKFKNSIEKGLGG